MQVRIGSCVAIVSDTGDVGLLILLLHSSLDLESIIKISGFLAAIKLTDKSGYPDNGYPDLQTLPPARAIE